jgi:ribosomal protein L37E
MKLDCGCDTLTGYKCGLHEYPWVTYTCTECGYPNALQHKYTHTRTYCESCGRRT